MRIMLRGALLCRLNEPPAGRWDEWHKVRFGSEGARSLEGQKQFVSALAMVLGVSLRMVACNTVVL